MMRVSSVMMMMSILMMMVMMLIMMMMVMVMMVTDVLHLQIDRLGSINHPLETTLNLEFG